MELREALSQISHIRGQMARAAVFRGYRSLTVAFSGLAAIAGAAVQSIWIPRPIEQLDSYLSLWLGIAVVSAAAAGLNMWVRCQRNESPLARQLTMQAMEQFLPCIVAGALLTAVIAQRAIEAAWMLPGLWSLLFSLGIFASFRLLPRAVYWSGIYYLLCGVLCLALTSGEAALWPWTMGLTFGGGQLLTAGILYVTLERPSRECQEE